MRREGAGCNRRIAPHNDAQTTAANQEQSLERLRTLPIAPQRSRSGVSQSSPCVLAR